MAKSLQYQIIKRARELVTDRNNWLRGYYCKERGKAEAAPWDKEARRFCAHGAIVRAFYELTGVQSWFPTVGSITGRTYARLQSINDFKGQAELDRMLETA